MFVIAVSVAPFAGAWIEINIIAKIARDVFVAPFAGAWIEIFHHLSNFLTAKVAPFAGAWIEIPISCYNARVM